MTKLTAMPIYGKNLKNHLLYKQKADALETWYAASDARVLPRLLKWWPWVDLDLFYLRLYTFIKSWNDVYKVRDKVKFGSLCCCTGKGKTDFSEITVVDDVKAGRCS